MIMIDVNAEIKLEKALEGIRAQQTLGRCLHFSLKDRAPIARLKEDIIKNLRRYFPDTPLHIYICGDGDIFILAPLIHTKDMREFIDKMYEFTGTNTNDEWIHLLETPHQINALLLMVEPKAKKTRLEEEAAKKHAEKIQAEKKRQIILSGGTHSDPQEIKSRRTNRKKPELMIIEDDIFSRKLVENVLQKQFSLTCLSETSNALDTYSRLAPDVLFLDINLPDVTGHDLLEKIMQIDPDSYVIMLSGNSDQANIMQALKLGAKGFVAKPFTREKLTQYIERCPTIKHT